MFCNPTFPRYFQTWTEKLEPPQVNGDVWLLITIHTQHLKPTWVQDDSMACIHFNVKLVPMTEKLKAGLVIVWFLKTLTLKLQGYKTADVSNFRVPNRVVKVVGVFGKWQLVNFLSSVPVEQMYSTSLAKKKDQEQYCFVVWTKTTESPNSSPQAVSQCFFKANHGKGSPWQRVTMATGYHGKGSSWQWVTMATGHHGDRSPWQWVTMAKGHHGNGLPWQRATMATGHHGNGSSWQRVTMATGYHGNNGSPWQQRVTMATGHHGNNGSPWQGATMA